MAIASGFPPRRAAGRGSSCRLFMIGASEEEKAPHRGADRGRGPAHGLLRPGSTGRSSACRAPTSWTSSTPHSPGWRRPSSGRSGCWPTRPTRSAAIPTTSEGARSRYGTNLLPVDRGVCAGPVGHEGSRLSYARWWRGFPAGLLHRLHGDVPGRVAARAGRPCATSRDAVRKDPTMINEIHETLRTILAVSGGGQPRGHLRAAGAGPRKRCGCCSSSSSGAS